MSAAPLTIEIIFTFCLAATLLYQYGNWYRHHVIVTLSVLIAWFFSFTIIFILPMDVSGTLYRQCIDSDVHAAVLTPTAENGTNSTDFDLSNITTSLNTTSDLIIPITIIPSVRPDLHCKKPWSFVDEGVMCQLWRVVYWTSQCLTWLILPLMQSYTQAGDFRVKDKLRSAVVDNAIYYGSYMFICGILLIYIAVQPDLDLDWPKLKAIAASASNTWGLFLLVLLLGYGLVEIPRNLWNSSKKGYVLQNSYFRVAKLSMEKSESEENLDDILETIQIASELIRVGHPLRGHLETIFIKIPAELQDHMNRRGPLEDLQGDVPTEKSLVRLHKQTIKALQRHHRTETQWNVLIEDTLHLEDVSRNEGSSDRHFKPTFPAKNRDSWFWFWYTPFVEWYWQCRLKNYVFRILSVICAVISFIVVWSEVTFFNKEPVLSLFAVFVNVAKISADYLTIEFISCLTIAYLCICAYSTVFKIRVLNFYYLSPFHQTDEYSLIFCGMMLCRLTPPMCLNFLSLIHMDSHIIKETIKETCYTKIMGHMDVISIISDGFNVYFPMAILALCLATYFKLGSRLLSLLSFQQFIGDDEITTNLVEDGRELVKREKRRIQRMEETASRHREVQEKYGSYRASARQRAEERARPIKRAESSESARAELLGDTDPIDYMGTVQAERARNLTNPYDDSETIFQEASSPRTGPPPKGIFDDV